MVAKFSALASLSNPSSQEVIEESLLRSYRLDLRYVGSTFHGWQSQPSGAGVQDHVERALMTILKHRLRVTAASRTDSGVHAEHQVCTFRTHAPFDEYRWTRALQALLPEGVGIIAIREIGEDFHPIYHAKGKAYRYRLWRSYHRHPMMAAYALSVPPDINIELMRRAALDYVGRHDFTSFCAIDSNARGKVRSVLEVAIDERSGPLVDFWVTGHGFLKQMVRIMVGTLLDIGMGKLPPGSIPEILAAKDRVAAGKTARAHGLSLVEIFYDEIPPLHSLIERCSGGFSIRAD